MHKTNNPWNTKLKWDDDSTSLCVTMWKSHSQELDSWFSVAPPLSAWPILFQKKDEEDGQPISGGTKHLTVISFKLLYLIYIHPLLSYSATTFLSPSSPPPPLFILCHLDDDFICFSFRCFVASYPYRSQAYGSCVWCVPVSVISAANKKLWVSH